ncbi:MAG: universal stress protein [Planctomycetia bacterium]|nr:universal stress protein [Planctomycetia bacterium]
MSGNSVAFNVKLFLSEAQKALLEAGVSAERAGTLVDSLSRSFTEAMVPCDACKAKRILVAVDFSPSAARAVETALSLSGELGAEVGVVHVVDVSPVSISNSEHLTPATLEKLKREGETLCRSVVERSRGGKVEHFVRCGNPAGEILATARMWKADLIVIGSHGRSTAGKFFLGSTVETVVRESDCPVMAVGPIGGCFCRHADPQQQGV